MPPTERETPTSASREGGALPYKIRRWGAAAAVAQAHAVCVPRVFKRTRPETADPAGRDAHSPKKGSRQPGVMVGRGHALVVRSQRLKPCARGAVFGTDESVPFRRRRGHPLRLEREDISPDGDSVVAGLRPRRWHSRITRPHL
jgi:hypothetical protein